MSAPAQVTEAHRELACTLTGRHYSISEAAELIADSEARATAPLRARISSDEELFHEIRMKLTAACGDPYKLHDEALDAIIAERDQLRAVFPEILAALGNGAGCTPDVSVEFIQSIPNEVAGVVAQLRAEVAWWKNWHDENEKMEDGIAVKVQATIDGLRAEVERLKAKISNQAYRIRCLEGATNHATGTPLSRAIARAESAEREAFDWKKIARYETARAERAEAEVKRLGHLEAVLRSSAADMTAGNITAGGVADLRAENERLRRAYVRPDDIRVQLESAIARAERAEAELAAERARLADLVADLNDACITLESAENDCDDYAMQNTAFKLNAVRAVLLQYIPNAAMKEGGK